MRVGPKPATNAGDGGNGNTVRPWFILAAMSLARVCFGYQFQTVATLAPYLMPRFQLTYAALGALIGAFMLLGLVAALPLGLIARRFGDRFVIIAGLALMIVGPLIAARSAGPDGIALGRTVSGVGAVSIIVLQGKVVADWFQGRSFMLAISISVCSYPMGVGLAQLVLPSIAAAFDWQAGFLSGAALAAVAFLAFVVSYRAPPQLSAEPRRFSLPSGRECLLLGVAGLCWTAYTAGYTGYTSYIPATMAARGEAEATTALVMTIATWGSVPATLFGGGLAARFGGLRIFLIGTSALVIGMAATALAGQPVFWALIVGVVGSIHPGVIMAVGTLSARPEGRAVGMAVFYSLYYLGGTIAPALCGRMADLYGSPAGGLLGAAALSAFAFPTFLLHRAMGRHETMLARA
jgi:predicted MFS family arabinose efflux permease